MSKICMITGKKPMRGNNVSHSNIKTKRRFSPNLQEKKFYIPETDEWVILADVTMENLEAGTYYLTETQADGYELPAEDLCFTIAGDGTVKIVSGGALDWLTENDDREGHVTFVLTIPNYKMFKKVDIANPDSSALEGAKFNLYRVVNGEREETPLYEEMTSGADGFLYRDGNVFQLPSGVYHLIETEAPSGYNIKSDPVVVTVSNTGVTYDEKTSLSGGNKGISEDDAKGVTVYTIKLSNSAGHEIPSTGGPGTVLLYVIGLALIAGAAIAMVRQRAKA